MAFDDSWDTASNWRGSLLPPNNGTADITLGPAVDAYTDYSYYFSSYPSYTYIDYYAHLYVSTDQNIHTLNFTGDFRPYDIWGNGDGNVTLTIQSGLTYSPTSTVDSGFEDSLNFALAGSQTWNITNGSLEIDGSLIGSATLTKSGAGELRLFGDSRPDAGFTGDLVLNEGGLLLGSDYALGAGTLVINGSSVAPYPYLATAKGNSVEVDNDVILNGGSFQTLLKSPLTLSGTVTLAADTTIAPQTHEPLYLSGTVDESGGSHSLTINGPGVVALTGVGIYTGGSNVSNGVLIFGAGSSIPSTGLLKSTGDGYIGIATPPDGLQSSFIDKFNKANTTGTIGFDTGPDSEINTFDGDIDLSSAPTDTAFNAAARLGSATQAILTGNITPQGTIYNFGGGGGWLEVDSELRDPLSGSRSLVVNSSPEAPLTLRLNPLANDGSNSYSGATTVAQSALIFAAGALPPAPGSGGSYFNAGQGGYIGSEDATLSPADFISRFDPSMQGGIIGFDTVTVSSARQIVESMIDLGHFTSASDPGIYLGSATNAVIQSSSTIILPATATAYRFAGYKAGYFEVDASLADNGAPTSVIIGDPNVPATFNDPTQTNSTDLSTVMLAGNNGYTGGTTFYAGRLIVGQSNEGGTTNALGTGALTVQPVNFTHDSSLRPYLEATYTPSGTTIPNNVVLNTDLGIGGTYNFTLSGAISGTGGLYKEDSETLTLSGNNTFAGGVHIGTANESGGTVVFATDTAAGSGPLVIDSGTAQFTSSNPTINGLAGTGGTEEGASLEIVSGAVFTINQNSDSHFFGNIDTGNTSIVKTGSGRLFFEESNDYSGGTTINDGALIAGNNYSFGSGPVTLSGGKLDVEYGVTVGNNLVLTAGMLGGFGVFDPPHRPAIGSSVILAPGSIDLNAPGILRFGTNGLALTGGGALNWQLQSVTGGPGIGWDEVAVADMDSALDTAGGINTTGVLDITATVSSRFKIKLISLDASGGNGLVGDFNSSDAYSWLVATATGGVTNFNAADFTFDTSSFQNALNGGTFSLSQGLGEQTNELFLNFTPVPEPSTCALMASGLGLVLLTVRQRKKSAGLVARPRGNS